jgi:hypothetical protein
MLVVSSVPIMPRLPRRVCRRSPTQIYTERVVMSIYRAISRSEVSSDWIDFIQDFVLP